MHCSPLNQTLNSPKCIAEPNKGFLGQNSGYPTDDMWCCDPWMAAAGVCVTGECPKGHRYSARPLKDPLAAATAAANASLSAPNRLGLFGPKICSMYEKIHVSCVSSILQ